MLNANAEGINKSVYSSWCQKRDGGEKEIQVKDTREEDTRLFFYYPFLFFFFLFFTSDWTAMSRWIYKQLVRVAECE